MALRICPMPSYSNVTIIIKMHHAEDDLIAASVPIGTIMPIDIGKSIPDNWALYNTINFAKVKTYLNAAT